MCADRYGKLATYTLPQKLLENDGLVTIIKMSSIIM
jgi:hypothetical protein